MEKILLGMSSFWWAYNTIYKVHVQESLNQVPKKKKKKVNLGWTVFIGVLYLNYLWPVTLSWASQDVGQQTLQ